MSKKKKKGHIKAPLTYDPGKGRPKEHLAYLNWQEMQALKRLNGNNMERGPKGLPSFADDSASSKGVSRAPSSPTSGSTSSRTGSTSMGSNSRSTSGTSISRSTSSTSRSTSTAGTGRGVTSMGSSSQRTSGTSISRNAAGTGRGVTSMGSNSQNTSRTTNKAGFSGGRSGFSGAGTQAVKDAAVRSAAEKRNTNDAFKSPSLKNDISRPSTIGRPVSPAEREGGIKGAIASVAQAAKKPTQPRDMQGPIPKTVSPNAYGWGATGPSLLPSYQANKVYGGNLAAQGRKFDQSQYDTLLNANTVANPALQREVNALSPKMRQSAAILSSAAKFAGVDPRLAIGMGAAESTLGTAANRAGSQYRGLMQMGTDAWNESANKVSRSLGPDNPWASAQAGLTYANRNRNSFVRAFGQEPTLSDLYGMHQQGAKGYISLRQNPDSPAYKVVGMKAVKGNLPDSLQGSAKKLTASQFADRIAAYPQDRLAGLSGVPVSPSQATAPQVAAAAVAIPTVRPDRYVDPAVAAGARPKAYATPEKYDPLSSIRPPAKAPAPAYDPLTSMRAPARVAAPAYNPLSSVRAPAPAAYNPLSSVKAPAPAAYNPLSSVRAPAPAAYNPLSSVRAPTGKIADNAPQVVSPPASITLEPMDVPAMPGAPKGKTVKTDVYTVKPGSIPADAEKTIADVLQNPDKIVQVAKEGKWGVQDKAALADIKKDIESLKEMGVKVVDGKISIPKAAAAQAQKTLNKIATSYSPMFGKMAPGYGKTFSEGLGKISKKSTTTETKPPSAAEMGQYDMNMADYRDAMRGLAMSPSLQAPGARYASAAVSEQPAYRDPAAVAQRPAERGIASLDREALTAVPSAKPDTYRDPAVVAGKRPDAYSEPYNPLGSIRAPAPAAPPELRTRGIPSVAPDTYRDPAVVAGERLKAYSEPYDPLTSVQPRKADVAKAPIPRMNPLNDPTKFIQVRSLHGTKPEVLSRLVSLQEQLGEPLRITSGYRSPSFNAKVHGARGSQHIHANAVDIEIQNPTPERVASLIRNASALGFTGIGAYKSGRVHVDLGNKRVWSNGNDGSRIKSLPGPVQQALNDHKAGKSVAGPVPTSGTVPGYKQDQLPRYVSPEQWQTVLDQEKKNKIGLTAMKRVPLFGAALSGIDAIQKPFTGKSLAEAATDLKRAYMQASPEQKAEMRAKYPDVRRFAVSIGDIPSGGGSGTMQASAAKSGAERGVAGSDRNQFTGTSSRTAARGGSGGGSGKSGGSGGPSTKMYANRPEIYYYWDLGVNIPSPGDPNYTMYIAYLAERSAAAKALYT